MLPPMFELVCALCQVGAVISGLPPSDPVGSAALAAEGVQPTFLLEPIAPVPAPTAASIGEEWQLSDGRSLSLNLTPTRERCAPLLEMTF